MGVWIDIRFGVTVAAIGTLLACAEQSGHLETRPHADLGYLECPGAGDGGELVGQLAPEWSFVEWVNGPRRSLAELRGRVVLVRFWTAPACPHCRKTMPALQALAVELADQPVTFVGAFHSKPEGRTSLAEAVDVANGWGVKFPIAFDQEWKTLRTWWLTGKAHRHATSATFVVGKDGRFVHVHPGPVFFPSDDPAHARPNQDYLVVRAAVVEALKGSARLKGCSKTR